jgi:hypothetical protein
VSDKFVQEATAPSTAAGCMVMHFLRLIRQQATAQPQQASACFHRRKQEQQL